MKLLNKKRLEMRKAYFRIGIRNYWKGGFEIF